jgi:DNA-binding FrmR family transcriptional regulator
MGRAKRELGGPHARLQLRRYTNRWDAEKRPLDYIAKSTKLRSKIPRPMSRAPSCLSAAYGWSTATEKQLPEFQVSHTIREKTKLLNRVRRIRGQIEAVERALDQEIGCADVLQLIAGARGAINGLMAEVMEDHIRAHIIDPVREPDAQRAHAAEELIDVVRSYLK